MEKQFVLIDDDRITLYLHQAIIHNIAPQDRISGFENPADAIHYFQRQFEQEIIPSIILLDLNMPVISGWEVLDILQGLSENILRNLYIFIVSSSLSEDDTVKARNHPLVVEYLPKPLATDKMATAIEHIQSSHTCS